MSTGPTTVSVGYNTPIDDMQFQLKAFGYESVAELDQFEDYDLDTAVGIISEAGDILNETWQPVNKLGDVVGIQFHPEDGSVTMPEGFKEAYDGYLESGYMSLGYPAEYDGGGAPIMLALMIGELQCATNKSLSMCPGLSHGLISSLKAYGTPEQQKTWLPKLVTGEWAGTMCLTEPQSGTDLGLVNTKAVPSGDAYLLTGSKIWITFGEHDLTENIIHLVLARLPDAPEGIKGISAFIVPKFKLDGSRNGIYCTGVDHKMGIHASPTCVMSLEEAEGYIVGPPHKGMRTMFVMMNEARLNVGMEGLSLSEAAYQAAVEFAKERRQGRSLNPNRRDMSASADNILVHPDVRRQLLRVRSTTEAMRGICAYVAKQIDLSHHHPDADVRQYSEDILALLTPVVKSFFTDRGFLNTSEAMQVCGGIGYTTEWPIEQYMRDLRIAMIYEGTNHIQALDLVGRKLMMHGGRLLKNFQKEVTQVLTQASQNPEMLEFLVPTKAAFDDLTELTMYFAKNAPADPELIGASSSEYLNVFGYALFAFSWLVQCQEALEQADEFATTKLKTARFFFSHVLPEIEGHKRIALNGKETIMAFAPDEF